MFWLSFVLCILVTIPMFDTAYIMADIADTQSATLHDWPIEYPCRRQNISDRIVVPISRMVALLSAWRYPVRTFCRLELSCYIDIDYTKKTRHTEPNLCRDWRLLGYVPSCAYFLMISAFWELTGVINAVLRASVDAIIKICLHSSVVTLW